MIAGVTQLRAWTFGDPRVVVAILDGPVDLSHPSLAGARLDVVETVAPAAPAAGGPATRHGTAVASLIFGQDGDTGAGPVAGISPSCRGLVVPIFGEASRRLDEPFRPACSQLELARAILTALENGATIINISAGQFEAAATAEPILADAVARAIRRGALIVAAAGNDGCDCSHVPAALPGVLAVGALDPAGRPLESSNWGEVYRASGLVAPGAGLLAARAGGGSLTVAGTSFAAAVVSGSAALLASLLLAMGQPVGGARLRRLLLDSAVRCHDDVTICQRHLGGRLDLAEAARMVLDEGAPMSAEQTVSSPAVGDLACMAGNTASSSPPGEGRARAVAPSSSVAPRPVEPPAVDPARAYATIPAEGCACAACQAKESEEDAGRPSKGCGCAACQARDKDRETPRSAPPATSALVFALGQIGFDLVSEARRDSIVQHMGGSGVNPWDAAAMLAYLEDNPWEAASITWTLNIDQTPIYAIAPVGPFAAKGYEVLREFLDDQAQGRVELVSIAGRSGGRVRLFNGQVVPVVVPELRGAYSWSTGALVRAVAGEPPAESAPAGQVEAFEAKVAGVRGLLQKIYYELRNLGITADERALNYAATNAFEVERVFEAACRESLELDTVEVERSRICRLDSDCWDVKLYFFYPERQVQTVRKAFRFTVDVSDVVPVTVGPMRSWYVR